MEPLNSLAGTNSAMDKFLSAFWDWKERVHSAFDNANALGSSRRYIWRVSDISVLLLRAVERCQSSNRSLGTILCRSGSSQFQRLRSPEQQVDAYVTDTVSRIAFSGEKCILKYWCSVALADVLSRYCVQMTPDLEDGGDGPARNVGG